MADIKVAIDAARAERTRAQLIGPPVERRHVNPGSGTNFDDRSWEQIIYWLEELEREHHE